MSAGDRRCPGHRLGDLLDLDRRITPTLRQCRPGAGAGHDGWAARVVLDRPERQSSPQPDRGQPDDQRLGGGGRLRLDPGQELVTAGAVVLAQQLTREGGRLKVRLQAGLRAHRGVPRRRRRGNRDLVAHPRQALLQTGLLSSC